MSTISVVVATRNRPAELATCLASLTAQTLVPAEVIVVDDDPGGAQTPAVVARFGAHYVAGERRGLAAAHNRGLAVVRTPLVAFTDDDVIADRAWLERLAGAFGDGVACVTGRIVAHELDTPAQALIDAHGNFDKGTVRREFDLGPNRPADALFPFTAGMLGSGANMAFTRDFLRDAGGFDPGLGAGTLARGGDDLAAFFEVIQRRHRLVYEPAAVVRHRHARELRAYRRQLFGYGVGLTAYLTKAALDRPRLLAVALRRAPNATSHLSHKQKELPRDLRRLERAGMLIGPFAYLVSRARAARATR